MEGSSKVFEFFISCEMYCRALLRSGNILFQGFTLELRSGIFCFQGFTLEFYFEANEYFSNPVLTKHYTMKSEPDEDEPFSFEGPEIIKCKG